MTVNVGQKANLLNQLCNVTRGHRDAHKMFSKEWNTAHADLQRFSTAYSQALKAEAECYPQAARMRRMLKANEI
jgi:hypothetical protein